MTDPSNVIQFLFLFMLLLLSAFFSSAETALTTANKIRMRTLAEGGDKKAARVLHITEDSGKMLSAILIGNNIVNLSASSLATTLAMHYFGNAGAGIATGILTFLILIFGEVSPKTMATIKADKLARNYAGIISFLMIVLTPIIFIINRLSMAFLSLLRVKADSSRDQVTEEEIRTIVDVGQESGAIESEERQMIHNLFDFGDAQAKEIMVPRIDMTFIREDADYEDILAVFREDKFTRIPVYESESDKVIGILNIKDLLLYSNSESFVLRDLLREPYFTFEHKNTADLFMEMRKSSISLAIVLDEYGDTAGLITLEDLLEEIVGEIRDEYDTDEVDNITKVSEFEYHILGSTNLDDVNTTLNLHLISEDYDTMGGYCLGLLNHLPQNEESFSNEEGMEFLILSVDNNRIEKIQLTLPHTDEEDPSAESIRND